MKRVLAVVPLVVLLGAIVLINCSKRKSYSPSHPPVEWNESNHKVHIPNATIITGGQEYSEDAPIPDTGLALVITEDSSLYFYSPALGSVDSIDVARSCKALGYFLLANLEQRVGAQGSIDLELQSGVHLYSVSEHRLQCTNRLHRYAAVKTTPPRQGTPILLTPVRLFKLDFVAVYEQNWGDVFTFCRQPTKEFDTDYGDFIETYGGIARLYLTNLTLPFAQLQGPTIKAGFESDPGRFTCLQIIDGIDLIAVVVDAVLPSGNIPVSEAIATTLFKELVRVSIENVLAEAISRGSSVEIVKAAGSRIVPAIIEQLIKSPPIGPVDGHRDDGKQELRLAAQTAGQMPAEPVTVVTLLSILKAIKIVAAAFDQGWGLYDEATHSAYEGYVNTVTNRPPVAPAAPTGRASGRVNVEYSYSASTTDPDEDDIAFRFDWGDGEVSEWSPWYSSGGTWTMSHTWSSPGTFSVKAQVKDRLDAVSDWSLGLDVVITNPTPGNKVWEFTTNDIVRSSPAVGADGTVYIGSNDSRLYAINPDNGTEKWEFTAGELVWSSPAVGADGTVFVGSYDNKLYAINPDNGTKKWEFPTGNWVHSSPALKHDGTMIYVGSYDGKLYAINSDGTKQWEYTTGGSVWSSPAIGVDGTIYIGCNDGKLYAVYPGGTERWEFTTGGIIWSSPAIGPEGVIYVGSVDGKLYAINPDGSKRWEFATDGPIWASPVVGPNGTVYVGSDDHKLYALSPTNGTRVWEFTTGDKVQSTPVIDDQGYIYCGSDDKKLYALNATTGSKAWEFTAGDKISSSPTIGCDGVIYFGSDDKKVYALYCPGPLNPTADWPKFRHDLRNTGRVGGGR